MGKLNPINREEAFYYQISDDVKVLHPLSKMDNKSGYEKQLVIIEQRIAIYRKLSKQK